MRTFHLDDIQGWDDGLICGGRMTILLHPLTAGSDAASYYRRLHDFAEQGRGFTEAVDLARGDRCLFDADGALAARCGPTAPRVAANLIPLSARPRPAARDGVAYLPILPRVTIFLVGGGHVGQATARLAAEVGFDVWVLDDRESIVSSERFPTASRRMVGDIGQTLASSAPELTVDIYALILTAAAIGTTKKAIFRLITSACGYVGMIGSKRKIKLICEDLAARGVPPEA